MSVDGAIEIPLLGSIKAAGLTKWQLRGIILEKLSSIVKSPEVVIRYASLQINVLGEVRSPGIQNFQKERVTILDALGASGDLTDFGKREDIVVIREENGKRDYYNIDLRNANLFQSPAFQLQQNDIVYVGASERKLKAGVNPNKQPTYNLA